jgi:tripartite-type tricarboxylate transporter receptor subunit TctC
MMNRCRLIFGTVLAFVLLAGSAHGQDGFFKGKTMHIIVGGPPGGGFDTYARMIARQMPKHIPGSPTIVVDNMPGAGMMIAANHVYKIAKPDGLTIGHFTGSQTINQALGLPGVEFDMRKFAYLGAPTADHFSCAFTKASGITNAERWLASKRAIKMGAVGPGNLTDNTLRVRALRPTSRSSWSQGTRERRRFASQWNRASWTARVGAGIRSNQLGARRWNRATGW